MAFLLQRLYEQSISLMRISPAIFIWMHMAVSPISLE
jgi:hypothetical protein